MPATAQASRSSLLPDYREGNFGGYHLATPEQLAELKRLFPDVDSPDHFLRGRAERFQGRLMAQWINEGLIRRVSREEWEASRLANKAS